MGTGDTGKKGIGDSNDRAECGRGAQVEASIGCSLFLAGFLFQNHYPRSSGAPFCRFRTLTRRPPSVDSSLSDPAWRTPVFTGAGSLYESEPVRRFVGLKLSGPLPDETTTLNFRYLLEKNNLGQGLLEEINAHLESQGLKLREGTIVDATIIEAPSSTKNRAGERDPEMHQTKKGNQWHFGMKAHIGVDADTGIVRSMSATAANVHDVTETHNLLHGGETVVWGDAGYQGVHKREENLGLGVEWRVAMRPGQRRKLEPESEEALAEKVKASVRAKVEHPFLRLKRLFGYAKVRYRGLAKNAERLALLFGLGNLLTAAGRLSG